MERDTFATGRDCERAKVGIAGTAEGMPADVRARPGGARGAVEPRLCMNYAVRLRDALSALCHASRLTAWLRRRPRNEAGESPVLDAGCSCSRQHANRVSGWCDIYDRAAQPERRGLEHATRWCRAGEGPGVSLRPGPPSFTLQRSIETRRDQVSNERSAAALSALRW